MLYDNYKCRLEFFCGDEKFKEEVIKNCPTLQEGVFYPTIWLPTTLLQQAFGNNAGNNANHMVYDLREILSDDGQKIQL